jgi:hypothetical protein
VIDQCGSDPPHKPDFQLCPFLRSGEADALAILLRRFDSHEATKITKDAQRPSRGMDREILREPLVIVVASWEA